MTSRQLMVASGVWLHALPASGPPSVIQGSTAQASGVIFAGKRLSASEC